MSRLANELASLDRLAGCTPRSIGFLEAAWPKDAPVSWLDAYTQAVVRGNQPSHDQHDGRAVAFLEGMLAGIRIGAA